MKKKVEKKWKTLKFWAKSTESPHVSEALVAKFFPKMSFQPKILYRVPASPAHGTVFQAKMTFWGEIWLRSGSVSKRCVCWNGLITGGSTFWTKHRTRADFLRKMSFQPKILYREPPQAAHGTVFQAKMTFCGKNSRPTDLFT